MNVYSEHFYVYNRAALVASPEFNTLHIHTLYSLKGVCVCMGAMASKEEDCFVPEEQVLQRNITKLHEANTKPLRLALDLVSQEVIPLQAFQRTLELNSSASQSDKIINALISAVTCSSGNFHKLIRILKDSPPLLSVVGTKMEEDYHGKWICGRYLSI